MKTGFGLLVLFGTSFAAYSQQLENDDMYFNSKDRAKINAISANTRIGKDQQLKEEDAKNTKVNPTDSYSSRNVNPEYVSRMKTNPDSQDEVAEYFISGYQPTGVNGNLYQGNYGQGSFSSPYYGNSWNSPNRFNQYGYGFGNPYSSFYGSPYSYYPSRFSMGWGNGWNAWNSGWYGNMFYGMGNMWGYPYGNSMYYDPFNSWGNYGYYNNFCSYNSFYGYNNFYGGYPGTVVVINSRDNYGRNVVYGKRNDRSSGLNNDVDHNRAVALPNGPGRSVSSGRTRSDVAGSQQYYDRSWRRNAETSGQSTSGTSRNVGSSGTDQNSGNGRISTRPQRSSSWGNSNSGSSNSGTSYSRPQRSSSSSWGDSNPGGSRSSNWSNGNTGNSGSSFQHHSGGGSNIGSSGGGSRSSGGNSGGGGSSSGSHSRGRN